MTFLTPEDVQRYFGRVKIGKYMQTWVIFDVSPTF